MGFLLFLMSGDIKDNPSIHLRITEDKLGTGVGIFVNLETNFCDYPRISLPQCSPHQPDTG